jgi:phosphate starvation-inducible PhoH-like protein
MNFSLINIILLVTYVTYVNGYKNGYILNDLQLLYKSTLQNYKIPIVVCSGPAGTGKTMIACHEAIDSLKSKKINKIIITRPTITVEENIGFLPGTLEDKLYPFMIPIYDYFSEYFTKEQINTLISNGRLEIAPLAFMRGRTFSDTFIIADEMQNSSKNQFKMLLTRLGDNSKLVITGDLLQNDLGPNNGLKDFIDILDKKYKTTQDKNIHGFEHIKFENSGVKRNPIIKTILELYDNEL